MLQSNIQYVKCPLCMLLGVAVHCATDKTSLVVCFDLRLCDSLHLDFSFPFLLLSFFCYFVFSAKSFVTCQ